MKQLFKRLFYRLPLSPSRRHQVSTWLKRFLRLGRTAELPPLVSHEVLATAELHRISGRQDWLYFGVIDWHFRFQRPQQLAMHIAAQGKRVFYISPHFIDSGTPGYQLERLDTDGFLYQVRLAVAGAPAIYFDAGEAWAVAQVKAGLAKLLHDNAIWQSISVVQHAYWTSQALALPNNSVLYDCMDHHEGFGNVASSLQCLEQQLLSQADCVSVTSEWLGKFAWTYNPHVVTIRNACDYAHFFDRPEPCYKDPFGRHVIGYFGAIAEWFDVSLIERLAKRFDDCVIVLIGNDTLGAGKQLAHLPNVALLGEKAYASLPHYLHGFDVCLLPFKVMPLTLATNPVKVYEYLCAGKHVVCVDLPEIAQFDDLVYKANNLEEFEVHVENAIASPPTGIQIQQRQAFAKSQTWGQRALAMQGMVKEHNWPLISVVVLTYNNLELTRQCIDSLFEYTDYPNWELVIVDNASSDQTPEYLQHLAMQNERVRLILSETNTGFARGNNLGLEKARGEYLVMLNNDTMVTPGWLFTLWRHFQVRPRLGLLGPVTNNIGNEAKVDVGLYSNMADMALAARSYTLVRMGQLYPMHTVAFFCVMLPRHVYEKVGGLDEKFGRGFFEDDDYCRRVQQLDLDIACAEDVFVHHHLSASFGQLLNAERQKLFDTNKIYYESKWGPWMPHRYRS